MGNECGLFSVPLRDAGISVPGTHPLMAVVEQHLLGTLNVVDTAFADATTGASSGVLAVIGQLQARFASVVARSTAPSAALAGDQIGGAGLQPGSSGAAATPRTLLPANSGGAAAAADEGDDGGAGDGGGGEHAPMDVDDPVARGREQGTE